MAELSEWETSLKLYKDMFFAVGNLATSTRAEYVAILKDLKAYVSIEFGIESLEQIAGYHLRKYIEQFNFDDLPSSKIGRKRAAICSFFDFLTAQGIIEVNPAFDLRKRRSRPRAALFDGFGPSLEEKGEETAEPAEPETSPPAPSSITAQDIKTHLDTKVVGQELAKIQISILMSMHMNWFKAEERMHRSPNAIVLGPTGVGKTHTLRVAGEYLKVPFVSVDITSLVPSGIAGLQVEDILGDLVREAEEIIKREGRPRYENDDIELARRGIIFFDEFDKISTARASRSTESTNLSVQRRLLKLTDGAVLGIAVRGHIGHTDIPRSIDTSGILIIAGGAFVGIDDNRIRTQRPAELQRELSKTNPNIIVSEDIVNYGFMPELVARLPVLVEYGPLSESDLLRIMDIPDVSPTQVWIHHFQQLGKELIIAEDAKEYAVKKAQVLKMGARGLHQVLFPALANIAFDIEASSEATYEVTAKKLMQASEKTRGGTDHAK